MISTHRKVKHLHNIRRQSVVSRATIRALREVLNRDVTPTHQTSRRIKTYRIFQSPPTPPAQSVMAHDEARETLITNVHDVIRLKFRRQKSLPQRKRKHQRPYRLEQQQQADVIRSPLNCPTFAWNSDRQQVQATRTAGRDKWIPVCNAFQRRQS